MMCPDRARPMEISRRAWSCVEVAETNRWITGRTSNHHRERVRRVRHHQDTSILAKLLHQEPNNIGERIDRLEEAHSRVLLREYRSNVKVNPIGIVSKIEGLVPAKLESFVRENLSNVSRTSASPEPVFEDRMTNPFRTGRCQHHMSAISDRTGRSIDALVRLIEVDVLRMTAG